MTDALASGVCPVAASEKREPELFDSRLLWMNVGLDVGYVATGAVLAVYAWTAAKRSAGVGAGTGIVIQGVALLVIDLQYASMISR